VALNDLGIARWSLGERESGTGKLEKAVAGHAVNDCVHYERSVLFEFANVDVSAAVSREMLERIRSEGNTYSKG
jgi:hypothetical protein